MNTPTKDYFKNSNQYGYKHIKKHFPEFYEWLLDKYKEYPQKKFPAYLYMYFNNLNYPPICPVCGKPTLFLSYDRGFQKYCSLKCSNNDPDVVKKKEQTSLKRYGVIKPQRLDVVKRKSRNTAIKNHGGQGNESISIKEKQKQTMIDRYGVECFSENPELLEKSKQTKFKRYGDANYTNREKSKQTCLEKYGHESPLGSKNIQEKSKQTLLTKYGVRYITQNEEIKNKINKTKSQNYKSQILQTNSNIIDVFVKPYKNKEITWFKIKCQCPNCDKCCEKEFELPSSIYYDRVRDNTELCSKLLPVKIGKNSGTSQEVHIRQLLDKYNIKYELNTKMVLGKKELDIYIPNYNIAIECNGIYWHSTRHKIMNYHMNKMIECKEKRIQLINIWQDWDINKLDIVNSLILSKLKIYDNRLYARQCVIKEVPSKEGLEFLDKNHIQGRCHSNIKVGLYYNEKLISIMTFTKNNSKFMGSTEEWTLSRFCTQLNTQVIGAADRLLKYFIRTYKPKSINSFASNDISNGGIYKKLGFEEGDINNSYWYINPHTYQRYHRYTFNKRDLIKNGENPALTEESIMLNKGYCKIYDSGTTKYVLYLNKKGND